MSYPSMSSLPAFLTPVNKLVESDDFLKSISKVNTTYTTPLVTVRSVDKSSSSDTTSNFGVNFKVSCGVKRSVELLEASIPLTFYNVVTGVNDTVDFKQAVTTYAATISPGAYTISSLATAIQTAMSAKFSGFTVAYDSTSEKVTISNASTFNLLFGSGTNLSRSIGPTIGFAVADVTGTNTYTGSNAVVIAIPSSILLLISTFGIMGRLSNGVGYTFRIPIASPNNTVLVYTAGQNYRQKFYCSPTVIQNMNVALMDENGTAISLNGSNWSFTIGCDMD